MPSARLTNVSDKLLTPSPALGLRGSPTEASQNRCNESVEIPHCARQYKQRVTLSNLSHQN